MAWKFLTDAKDYLLSPFRTKPVDLPEKKSSILKNAFTDNQATPQDIAPGINRTEFINYLKNETRDALASAEVTKKTPAEVITDLGQLKNKHQAKLTKLHQEESDAVQQSDNPNKPSIQKALKDDHKKQQEAFNQYFAEIEQFFIQMQPNPKKNFGPTEAHLEADAAKPKLATINGDEKNPSKKESKLDLFGYNVPVHYKNGTFTFYNVKNATTADVTKAVDELQKKGYTGIHISGKFSKERQRDMWLHAQCKQPPMAVVGYAPTEGDFKVLSEKRKELRLPAIPKPKADAASKANNASTPKAP